MLTTRAARREDLDAITEVVNAAERYDKSPEVTPRDMLEADFDNPAQDPDRDSVIIERDGVVVGFGWCFVPAEAPRTHLFAFVWVSVLPDARAEVGDDLARRMSEIGASRLRDVSTSAEKVIRATVMGDLPEERARWERLGFEPIRWFTRMSRPLDDPMPDPGLLSGVRIRGWLPDDEEPTRVAHNSAFADHWGSMARSVHDWRTHTNGDSHFRSDLSLVAEDEDGAVAGYLLAHHYPEDAETTGRDEVWVSTIGVRQPHRGRGLASSLLLRALQQSATTGFEFAGLEVDSDSPTGANRLYERLGFATTGTTISYGLTVH